MRRARWWLRTAGGCAASSSPGWPAVCWRTERAMHRPCCVCTACRPPPSCTAKVYDVTLAGDAEITPMAERPAVHAIVAEPEPTRKLALYASMVLVVAQRMTPVYRVLRAAAAATPADEGPHDLLREAE